MSLNLRTLFFFAAVSPGLSGCLLIANLTNSELGSLSPELLDPYTVNEIGGSGAPLTVAPPAPFILFQDDAVSNTMNRGGAVQRNGVRDPYYIGAYVDPQDGHQLKFFTGDRRNNRVLIFNSVPTNSSAQPDVVVGQPDFTSALANAGGAVGPAGFNEVTSISVCGDGKMFVSDRTNNRVLGYNSIPKTNGVQADFVIGQPDFSTTTPGTDAKTLTTPYGAYCMDGKFFVMDYGNNRIMVYDPIPTSSYPAASFVIGQPDFFTGSLGCAANKLNAPYTILKYQGKLYVADGANFRVLVYNSVPTASGAVADTVIGQANMTSCAENQGGGVVPTAKSLAYANGLTARDNILAVHDHTNDRVMFFNLPVVANNPTAFYQVGQPDFVTGGRINPATANSDYFGRAILFAPGYIYSGDSGNNRINVHSLPF